MKVYVALELMYEETTVLGVSQTVDGAKRIVQTDIDNNRRGTVETLDWHAPGPGDRPGYGDVVAVARGRYDFECAIMACEVEP